MKISKSIIYVAILFCLIFLVAYVVKFPDGFSDSHIRWGQFGSYIGGVLGTVLSFTTLLIVIKNNGDTNDRFINESKLREQNSNIEFVQKLLFEIINTKYELIEFEDVLKPYPSIKPNELATKQTDIFDFFSMLIQNIDLDETIKIVSNKHSRLTKDINTFSSQLTYFTLLIDEVHGKKENYNFNISILKYKLSLFKGALPLLKELKLIEEATYERYLMILYLPYDSNQVLTDKKYLKEQIRKELDSQGFNKFKVDFKSITTSFDNDKFYINLTDKNKILKRTPIDVNRGIWEEQE